ncbi:MAG: tetraacyldisaccharide 4'-kinase [Candidatus Omnitrophica bacterium]|nr:tetraacyldisaccharide 4'-kinase [Candidatus Omnitrophota bacterium]
MRQHLYNLATDKTQGFVPGIIKIFLFLLSLVYGLTVRILAFFYRIKPYCFDCKIIGIGNITLGGTGKTALVEYVARYLKSQGHKFAIISRGYKKQTKGYTPNVIGYEEMGDEPYMLQKRLTDVPVIVDTNRIRAISRATRDYPLDIVILDDAFQQWRIKKDLEIVTIDAVRPFGNGQLIPRGILREPLSSLRRADIIVITKANLISDTDLKNIKDILSRINPKAEIFESIHHPVGFYRLGEPECLLPQETIVGKPVTLFSGIGSPDSFEQLIRNMGIKIGLVFRFPDHQAYTNRQIERIINESFKKNIENIITTEKDAARLTVLFPAHSLSPIMVLRIELKIIYEEERFNRLLGLRRY